MAGFHGVADEFLIREGLLEVPTYEREVGAYDLGDLIQVTANTTG